jgi:hypothetical protein
MMVRFDLAYVTITAVLAGMDVINVEVLTRRGLATYYVLFFLYLETDVLPSLPLHGIRARSG